MFDAFKLVKFILPVFVLSSLTNCGGNSDKATYTVNFNTMGHGSTYIPYQKVNNGDKVNKPTDPSENGYTFNGWYKETECSNQWDFDRDVVKSDLTLYAKWDIKNYTVKFDSIIGSEVPPQSIDYNSKVTKPADPTVEGYKDDFTFKGWYKDIEYKEAWDFDKDVVTQDMTLYANYEFNGLLVILVYDKDAEDYGYQYKHKGDKVDKPSVPSPREGYHFDNYWYKDESLTKEQKWDFDNDALPAESESPYFFLYAGMRPIVYPVEFDLQGYGGEAPDDQKVAYKSKIKKPDDPKDTYFTFEGWYKESECINKWDFENDTMPANYVTLYAKWANYWVYFDVKGHGDTPLPQLTPSDELVTKPKDLKADGYTFAGWYKDSSCKNEWDFTKDKMPHGNLTLYAKWVNYVSFYDDSWENVIKYANEGTNKLHEVYYQDCEKNRLYPNTLIGLERPVYIDKIQRIKHNVRVIDENYDTLSSDNNVKAALTFEFSTLVSSFLGNYEEIKWAEPDNNNWENSHIRDYLNDYFLKQRLPEELTYGIKQVSKKTYDASQKDVKEYPEYLFPLSVTEMGYGHDKAKEIVNPYKYYEECGGVKDAKRIKVDGKGNAFGYWLRSPVVDGENTRAWASTTNGELENVHCFTSYRDGFAPAFCI